MYGESIRLRDNLTFSATDRCLQPAMKQSCSGPSVSVAAGARTRLVLSLDMDALLQVWQMHACAEHVSL